jgi:hypothetical protein
LFYDIASNTYVKVKDGVIEVVHSGNLDKITRSAYEG